MNPPPITWLGWMEEALGAPDLSSALQGFLTRWADAGGAPLGVLLYEGAEGRLLLVDLQAPALDHPGIRTPGGEAPAYLEQVPVRTRGEPQAIVSVLPVRDGGQVLALLLEGPPGDAAVHDALVTALRTLIVAHARLRRSSEEDGLTALPNRRAFDRILRREADLTARYGGGFSVVALDLDRFKEINDRFGHAEGDAVLKAVARAMRECVRVSDAAARLGGDEFALLLPRTSAAAAGTVVDRLAATLAALQPCGPVTFCCGILDVQAAARPAPAAEHLLFQADRLLYEAKKSRPGGRSTGLYRPTWPAAATARRAGAGGAGGPSLSRPAREIAHATTPRTSPSSSRTSPPLPSPRVSRRSPAPPADPAPVRDSSRRRGAGQHHVAQPGTAVRRAHALATALSTPRPCRHRPERGWKRMPSRSRPPPRRPPVHHVSASRPSSARDGCAGNARCLKEAGRISSCRHSVSVTRVADPFQTRARRHGEEFGICWVCRRSGQIATGNLVRIPSRGLGVRRVGEEAGAGAVLSPGTVWLGTRKPHSSSSDSSSCQEPGWNSQKMHPRLDGALRAALLGKASGAWRDCPAEDPAWTAMRR
ncbi:MAG: GGDEF domain-containing protein [Kiritimatiellia bacterium]